MTDHNSAVHCVTFSPDGRQLAAGASNGLVMVWEAATPRQVAAWSEETTRWENKRQTARRDREQKTEKAAEAPQLLAEVRERRLPERVQTPPNLFQDRSWRLSEVDPRKEVEATMKPEGNGVFRVEVRRISTSPWDIQLYHPGLTLEPRRKYILQFRARADGRARVEYGAQRDFGNYEPVNNRSGEAMLVPRWRAFRLRFTTNDQPVPKRCAVVLHLGGQTGTYWIADLMLVPDPDDQPAPASVAARSPMTPGVVRETRR